MEKGVSFYSFLKGENLNKRWLANIKRENINKYPKNCHKHLENLCFKIDLDVSLWYFYVNILLKVGTFTADFKYFNIFLASE